MSTSLASTVFAVTGLFTDMEVNGQTPQRTALYKFGKIMPLMTMTAVPRLISLSFIYSMANSATWMFYTVLTAIFFALYGLCYWGLQHFLKKKAAHSIVQEMHAFKSNNFENNKIRSESCTKISSCQIELKHCMKS